MAGVTFSKKVTNWDQLSSAVKPRLVEQPDLAEQQQELEQLVLEAKALLLEQETLRGQLRQAVRRRKEIEVAGDDARGRLAALVQGKLGLRNENLIGFGIAPKVRRRRKTKEGEQPVEVRSQAASAPEEPAK